MFNYLSLNRKNPSVETTILNIAIKPKKPEIDLVPYIPISSKMKIVRKTTNEPTPTIIHTFWILFKSFITKLN